MGMDSRELDRLESTWTRYRQATSEDDGRRTSVNRSGARGPLPYDDDERAAPALREERAKQLKSALSFLSCRGEFGASMIDDTMEDSRLVALLARPGVDPGRLIESIEAVSGRRFSTAAREVISTKVDKADLPRDGGRRAAAFHGYGPGAPAYCDNTQTSPRVYEERSEGLRLALDELSTMGHFDADKIEKTMKSSNIQALLARWDVDQAGLIDMIGRVCGKSIARGPARFILDKVGA